MDLYLGIYLHVNLPMLSHLPYPKLFNTIPYCILSMLFIQLNLYSIELFYKKIDTQSVKAVVLVNNWSDQHSTPIAYTLELVLPILSFPFW